jgi:hypothetical protein
MRVQNRRGIAVDGVVHAAWAAHGAQGAAEPSHVAEKIIRAIRVEILQSPDLGPGKKHAPAGEELGVVEKHKAARDRRHEHPILAARRSAEAVRLPPTVVRHGFRLVGLAPLMGE